MNVILILVTLSAIFTQRNFSEEYFIQRNIREVFSPAAVLLGFEEGTRNHVLGKATKFADVKHFESFQSFLETTLAYGLFAEDEDNKNPFFE